MSRSEFGSAFRRPRPNGNGFFKGWYVRWTDHDGRRRQCKGGDTKKEALDFLADRRAEKRHYETRGVLPVRKGSFSDVSRQAWPLIQKGKAETTVSLYEGCLEVLQAEVGDWTVCDVTAARLRKFLGELQERRGFGAGRRATYRNVLSAVFAFAEEAGYHDHNPVLAVKFPKPRAKRKGVRLSAREARLLLANTDAEFRPLFALMLFTGIRIGEALGLRWQDVEDDGITVRRSRPTSESTKSGRERWIPLVAQARAALEELRARAATNLRGPQAVWPLRVQFDSEAERANLALQRAAKAAGLPKLASHDLRRTFGHRCDEKGLTIFEIRDLLGHASVTMTETYVGQVKKDRLSRAMGALDENHQPRGSRRTQAS